MFFRKVLSLLFISTKLSLIVVVSLYRQVTILKEKNVSEKRDTCVKSRKDMVSSSVIIKHALKISI
jgi:hypothetical protein